MANDSTFNTSVSQTTVNAGEKQLGIYTAVCKITSTVTVTITRGLTSEPSVTSSSNLSAALASFSIGSGTWRPRFEDAVGTIITERAYRANEAGFWEKERTTEVRTASISAWNRETGNALTPIT